MAYLVKDELKSVIREYNLDAITDNDDTIVEQAIEAGIEQVSDMLTPNDKKEWLDGRPHYDVAAIFAKTGSDRNALMLANVKSVVMYHLIAACNTGVDYEVAVDRHEKAISYLKDLAGGKANSATLPKITAEPPADELPFSSGSRRKFNHE